MDLKPAFVAPSFAINLPGFGLPDGETRIATSLLVNLNGLRDQSNNLAGALSLVEFTETMPLTLEPTRIWTSTLPMLWRMIAFREGAMSLSNFAKFLEAVGSLVKRCPHIAPLVHLEALKQVRYEFRERFGRVEKLRDSVAHPELYANPDVNMAADQFVPPGSTDFRRGRIPGAFQNRRYHGTIKGDLFSYDLTEKTCLFVVGCVRRTYAAFDAVNRGAALALLSPTKSALQDD